MATPREVLILTLIETVVRSDSPLVDSDTELDSDADRVRVLQVLQMGGQCYVWSLVRAHIMYGTYRSEALFVAVGTSERFMGHTTYTPQAQASHHTHIVSTGTGLLRRIDLQATDEQKQLVNSGTNEYTLWWHALRFTSFCYFCGDAHEIVNLL